MFYKFEEGKVEIIDAIVKKATEQQSDEKNNILVEFIRQFYATVALEDLSSWTIDDLYAAAVNFFSVIMNRDSKEIKVHIYNPDFETHGWQNQHTVVEVSSRDIPFLVDTVTLVMQRMSIAVHLIIHVSGLHCKRKNGKLEAITSPRTSEKQDIELEGPVFMLIDRQTDQEVLKTLHENLDRVLADNQIVYDDWPLMRERVCELIDELNSAPKNLDESEVDETRAFLSWIEDHHFTFLGIRDYKLIKKNEETLLEPISHTGLGVLRKEPGKSKSLSISAMAPEARDLTMSSRILVMSKTNTEATIHRNAYTDYIGVKRFDAKGHVVGERRIIGLYTSAAYHTNPKHIPFLRHKVDLIIKKSQLSPRSHAGKILLNIIDTLPRDDLIQASEEELLEIAMGIFYMQERRRIRLFARVDIYRRFVSCLVYVPRDIFNSDLRRSMQNVLMKRLHGISSTFSTLFTESILARIHFIIRINPEAVENYDFKAIEKELADVGRSWMDELQSLLKENFGEEHGNVLIKKYRFAFGADYTTSYSPKAAVYDVKHIEQLENNHSLGLNFYKSLDDPSQLRLKVYRHKHTIPLSDVMPILENMGLRAISERPYLIQASNNEQSWVNEFSLQYNGNYALDIDLIRERFQDAFVNIWFGYVENDGFNRLVLSASLDWRIVVMLRTYAKYFKQISLPFSQDYIESALTNHPKIVGKLAKLFELKFSPNIKGNRDQQFQNLSQEILLDLDAVSNLDEDKIIRQYVYAIMATLRTNFYQVKKDGKYKNYVSLKLSSKMIPGMPRPTPLFEIFVYAPDFEGVHLRGGKVARGGLRWSDRKEDFRTEILGLMKAQQVKNAVIVPAGAKGGFVLKKLSSEASREQIQAEGVRCYQNFIRALLDITDNYHDGAVIKPQQVITYDDDDPYFVVAADKGTATFSDYANEISQEYNFWLGDAFASGGSFGYDHKKMGITARGAWESVRQHFYILGQSIDSSDFTVVGIGDMAGDVFGNGMLQSEHIQLIAAFNHLHIFIDPNPVSSTSFKERKRLFELPRSSWADYNKKLISQGGGVFNRTSKSIPVSPEMKRRFEIKLDTIEPNDLIKIILTSSYDLLWSGGIGTFVKATGQTNQDVGDRLNDTIRVNGADLRCKVVGEGGNLGFTQCGRIEYALNGGNIYTDFIDNSGGVSCSDKEVNIKILLNQIVESGDLTHKQRNELLVEMTEEVALLVLRENYLQPKAISLAQSQAARSLEWHTQYMKELEREGKLDRALESLPDDKILEERKLQGRGLSTPSLSVLLCYSKITLKEAVLSSSLPEDSFLNNLLIEAFPKPLQKKYSEQMQSHPLRREIISTRLSNLIVNEVGFSYVYRLQNEMGSTIPAIARAYMMARAVLNMEPIWTEIEALDNKIPASLQQELMRAYVRLLRRITRWFLRQHRFTSDLHKVIANYAKGVKTLKSNMFSVLSGSMQEWYNTRLEDYKKKNIPDALANEVTQITGLFGALDIIDIANSLKMPIEAAAKVYYGIGEFLELGWLRNQIIIHETENQWEGLSREALRDDLDWQQRVLTKEIARNWKKTPLPDFFAQWAAQYPDLMSRWRLVLSNLKSAPALTYTMYFVAIRELLDLTQATEQSV